MITTAGIHHVTGIAGDAQQNVDFYAGILGLRLVKVTVNFDDPHTYHLYYGDGLGNPGTIITFFPWPRARHGRAGVGQVAVTSFAIRPDSVGFWLERFVKHGVDHGVPERRLGETVIPFRDRHSLQLALVATQGVAEPQGWNAPRVPPDHAIRGLHSVTLWEKDATTASSILTSALGYEQRDEDDTVRRFVAPNGSNAAIVDVREVGDFLQPLGGAGTIHHVAFRAPTDSAELALRDQLESAGLHPTMVLDRKYFHSVYAREPGGVLFEIATDAPGFTVDEEPEELGSSLQLPAQFEPERQEIEARLPSIAPPLSPPLHRPDSHLGATR